MTETEQRRLIEALAFALAAHGDQTRKAKPVPYASHLLQVAGLVLEHGGDIDQAVAALLHDTLEDCEGVTEAGLRERFGAEVARIVVGCTDLLEGDTPESKSGWEARKRYTLEQIRAADPHVRLVAACDKLHNLANLVADLRAHGRATLERFTPPPELTLWYYEELRRALGSELPRALRLEMDACLEVLREAVQGS